MQWCGCCRASLPAALPPLPASAASVPKAVHLQRVFWQGRGLTLRACAGMRAEAGGGGAGGRQGRRLRAERHARGLFWHRGRDALLTRVQARHPYPLVPTTIVLLHKESGRPLHAAQPELATCVPRLMG
jgi:hypothetical protein